MSRKTTIGWMSVATLTLIAFAAPRALDAEPVVSQYNRAPYATNRNVVIAGKPGSTVKLPLSGYDPEGGNLYYMIVGANGAGKYHIPGGIVCWVENANELTCKIPKDYKVEESDQCKIGGEMQNHCKEIHFKYYIKDDGWTSRDGKTYPPKRSTKDYDATLWVMDTFKNPGDDADARVADELNPRAFFYTERGKWGSATKYGEAAMSGNPGAGMASVLKDISPDMAGLYHVANNTGDKSDLATDKLLGKSSIASTYMKGSVSALDTAFLNDIKSRSINNLGFDTNDNLPIYCNLKRKGIDVVKSYVCDLDPYVKTGQLEAATHYYGNGTDMKNALQTCQDVCKQQVACQDQSRYDWTDIVTNKNSITATDVLMGVGALPIGKKITSVRITERQNDGALINRRSYDFAQGTSADFYWPSGCVKLECAHTQGEISFVVGQRDPNAFISYRGVDAFIVKPKIEYYLRGSDGNEYPRNSYVLTSIAANVYFPRFKCPVEGVPDPYFEDEGICNDSCYQGGNCLLIQQATYQGKEQIENDCKDVTLSNGESLQSAYANKECKIWEEYSVDAAGNPIDYYVKDGAIVSPLRPPLEFDESDEILKKERAIEYAGAFMDMIKHGASQGRYGHSEKFPKNWARDYVTGRYVTIKKEDVKAAIMDTGSDDRHSVLTLLYKIPRDVYLDSLAHPGKEYGLVLFADLVYHDQMDQHVGGVYHNYQIGFNLSEDAKMPDWFFEPKPTSVITAITQNPPYEHACVDTYSIVVYADDEKLHVTNAFAIKNPGVIKHFRDKGFSVTVEPSSRWNRYGILLDGGAMCPGTTAWAFEIHTPRPVTPIAAFTKEEALWFVDHNYHPGTPKDQDAATSAGGDVDYQNDRPNFRYPSKMRYKIFSVSTGWSRNDSPYRPRPDKDRIYLSTEYTWESLDDDRTLKLSNLVWGIDDVAGYANVTPVSKQAYRFNPAKYVDEHGWYLAIPIGKMNLSDYIAGAFMADLDTIDNLNHKTITDENWYLYGKTVAGDFSKVVWNIKDKLDLIRWHGGPNWSGARGVAHTKYAKLFGENPSKGDYADASMSYDPTTGLAVSEKDEVVQDFSVCKPGTSYNPTTKMCEQTLVSDWTDSHRRWTSFNKIVMGADAISLHVEAIPDERAYICMGGRMYWSNGTGVWIKKNVDACPATPFNPADYGLPTGDIYDYHVNKDFSGIPAGTVVYYGNWNGHGPGSLRGKIYINYAAKPCSGTISGTGICHHVEPPKYKYAAYYDKFYENILSVDPDRGDYNDPE